MSAFGGVKRTLQSHSIMSANAKADMYQPANYFLFSREYGRRGASLLPRSLACIQLTTNLECSLWPSVRPRAFIQS